MTTKSEPIHEPKSPSALGISALVLLMITIGAIISLLVLELTYTAPKGPPGKSGPVGNVESTPKPSVISVPMSGIAFDTATISFTTQLSLTLSSFNLFILQTIPNNSMTLVCDWPFDSNDIVVGSCVNTGTLQNGSLFVNGGRLFIQNQGIWSINDRVSCQVQTS